MWGRLRSAKFNSICLDHLQRDEAHKLKTYKMGQYMCHSFIGNSQYYTLSNTGELRNEYMCAKVAKEGITMVPCDGNENNPEVKWEWIPVDKLERKGILKNGHTGKCLKPNESQSNVEVLAASCDNTDESFVWHFDFDTSHPDA